MGDNNLSTLPSNLHRIGILPVARLLGFFEKHPAREYEVLRTLGKEFLAKYETDDRKISPTSRVDVSQPGSLAREYSKQFLRIHGSELFLENIRGYPQWPQDQELIEIVTAHFLQQLAFRNYQTRQKSLQTRQSEADAIESQILYDSQSEDEDPDSDSTENLAFLAPKQLETNSCISYVQGLNPANEKQLPRLATAWLLDHTSGLPEIADRRLQRFMHEHNLYYTLDVTTETMQDLSRNIFEGIEPALPNSISNHPQTQQRINGCIEKHTEVLQDHFYISRDGFPSRKTEIFDSIWACREEYWVEKRQRKERRRTLPQDLPMPQKRRRINKPDMFSQHLPHLSGTKQSSDSTSISVEHPVLGPQGQPALGSELPSVNGPHFSPSEEPQSESLVVKLKLPFHQSCQPLGTKVVSSEILPISTATDSRTDDTHTGNSSVFSVEPNEVLHFQHDTSDHNHLSLEASEIALRRMKTVWADLCSKSVLVNGPRSHWQMRNNGFGRTEPRCKDGHNYNIRRERSGWVHVSLRGNTKEILVEDELCERLVLEWKVNPTLNRDAFEAWFAQRFTGATRRELSLLLREITTSVDTVLIHTSNPKSTPIILDNEAGAALHPAHRTEVQVSNADTPRWAVNVSNPISKEMESTSELVTEVVEDNETAQTTLPASPIVGTKSGVTSSFLHHPLHVVGSPISISSRLGLGEQEDNMSTRSDEVPFATMWASAESNESNEPLSGCHAFEEACFGMADDGGPIEDQSGLLQSACPNNEPVSSIVELASTLSASCKRCLSLKVKCINNGIMSTCNACAKSQRPCTYSDSSAKPSKADLRRPSTTTSLRTVSDTKPTGILLSDNVCSAQPISKSTHAVVAKDSAIATPTSMPPQSRRQSPRPIQQDDITSLVASRIPSPPLARDTTYQKPNNELIDARQAFDRTLLSSTSSKELVIASAKKEKTLVFLIEKADDALLDRDFPIQEEDLFSLRVPHVFELISTRIGRLLSSIQFECVGFGFKDRSFELRRYHTSEDDWDQLKFAMRRDFRNAKKKMPERLEFVIRIVTIYGYDDNEW
ncbi:hypothetical protein PVAG01_08732 [Phlyctema vagabunda]|uniref:Zn(2)-C6 fungal-type domain-containing protein n=1 Tax=Phlyctema vagabunda TaxID=108571 RepID=A0ABR4PAC5_9HELO